MGWWCPGWSALALEAEAVTKHPGVGAAQGAIRRDADARLRGEAGLIDEHLALVAKDPFHAWQRVFALEKKLAEKRATTITMQRLEVHFSKLLRKRPPTAAVTLPEQRPWEHLFSCGAAAALRAASFGYRDS